MTKPADKPADNASTPPWGDDFDAERAWTLVQNLRAERDTVKADRDAVKADRDALKAEKDAADDAKKTDEQKATDRLAAAEKTAAEAQRALFVERAVRKHNLDEDLVEFLTGADEEAVLAQAERLAARAAPKPEEPKEEDPNLSGRPSPALTPGHGGETSAPIDHDAIADAARRG